MNIRFLGQGFADISDESMGKIIIDSLGDKAFNQFTAIVAFASESGVRSVIEYIKNAKKHFTQIEFYIGVDYQGTSYEALNLLLKPELDCYIYHTVSHIIFHPKIYIFEGEEQGRIIIGSSNLTDKGLSKNVEASLVVDFKMNDEQGIKLLKQIKEYYRLLFDKTLPNIEKLTEKLIKQLFDAGIIVKEKDRREAGQISSKPTRNQALLSEIEKMFPPVKIPKNTPKSPKRKKSHVRNWQSTDPEKPNYRHPDIGSTAKDLQTKLKDKNGKVVSNGDVVEWIASKGDLAGQTLIGVVTNLTYNSGGKRYKDKHPRYHVFANVVLKDKDKDGKDTVVGKQVKIERVTKHNASGALAKQTRKSQKEFAARKAMQKASSK